MFIFFDISLVLLEPRCKHDADCPTTEMCLNGQCLNPCIIANPCDSSAHCQPINHKAMCQCPPELSGDPFVGCYPPVTTKPECTTDSDCPSDKSCINQHCQDPCALANPCGTNAQCRVTYHRPTCRCPDGWVGNPQVTCYKRELFTLY